MADNYLEKKMEQHKLHSVSGVSSKNRNSLSALLRRCSNVSAFDDFKVRNDQLDSLFSVVEALPSVDTSMFRLNALSLDEISEESHSLASFLHALPVASVYIMIHSTVEPSASVYFKLGMIVQTIMLRAAEMGLAVVCVGSSELLSLKEGVTSSEYPVAVMALGRPVA